MKRISLFNQLVILLLCIINLACNDKNDVVDDKIIGILRSSKWLSHDYSYGEGINDHAWIDIDAFYMFFKTDFTGIGYWINKDYDTDLGTSISSDYILFTYSASGDKVIITYEDNSIVRFNYIDGFLVTESGGSFYEPISISPSDYTYIEKLGPKTGSCGYNLSYKYDDRTKELIISGNGRMYDYSSLNQPWHDYNISKIIIKDGCSYVGNNAFYNLRYLVSNLDLSNSIQEIGDYAFCNMSITQLIIPTDIVRIGKYAFSDCKNLSRVNFSGCDVLEDIGDYAFAFCPISANYFTIPKSVKCIGSFAFLYSSFNGLSLNDNLESIGDMAFGELKISKLDIPNSVKSIGSQSFHGSFSEIRVGTGLTSIGNNPFVTSKSGKMYVNLSEPILLPSASSPYVIMSSNGGNAATTWSLYVPKGSKSAYQNAIGWKTFKTIYEDSSLSGGSGNNNHGVQDDFYYTGENNGYKYVDLGLSVKWAAYNIGSDAPEGYGDFFSWGETRTKSDFDWSNYKYANGSGDDLTKYCFKANQGYNYFTDSRTTLEMSDDVAHVTWGGRWRMPSEDEFQELIDNSIWTWTTINDVKGYKVTSKKNGYTNNSIFLPASGLPSGYYVDTQGYYWSSTLGKKYPDVAQNLTLTPRSYRISNTTRSYGLSVRPVCQ